MRDETRTNLRVGFLVVVALGVLAVAVFTIGRRQQLFVRHTRYVTTLSNVIGLQPGAPVQLDGVTVGFVRSIELPTDPREQRIRVEFTVQAAYTERIRTDTRASIKTLGLLGDKYLLLTGGSPEADRVLEGGTIPGQDPAEVERFIAGGEDLMENLLAISSSLRVVLARIERGEGLLGELTKEPEGGERFSDSARRAMATLNRILDRLDRGEGLAGRLLADDATGRRVMAELEGGTAAARRAAEALAADLERDDTAWAALMRDPRGRELTARTLESLATASEALAAAAQELATGEGTLPRLLRDREYAGDFLDDLAGLVKHLRSVTGKLDRGEGTLGAAINDPQLYRDLENVVRGVKSSRLLSWFIRNRRRKGEKVAAREAERAGRER